MPVITIETWPTDKTRKKELIKKITQVFTEMGVPGEAVTIVIHDTSLENWGTCGEQHCEKYKDLKR